MLERNASVRTDLAPPGATPTLDTLPRRLADFATIGEALDYAAKGRRGLNFHDLRGMLAQTYTYAELREDALVNARRFVTLGIKPGDRVALVAETGAEFAACFFGAVYAGAWPVPLPLPTSFGGRDAYVDQLAVQLKSCDPALLLYPPELADFCSEAAAKAGVDRATGNRSPRSRQLPADLPASGPTTSPTFNIPAARPASRMASRSLTGPCSTTSARTASASRSSNPTACVSWLPWYHDMGLVGCLLSPIAMQMSVDYLRTEDFARRPLAWLDMITRNPGTSVSYSPTFGYDICSRRMSSQTRAEDRFDL